MTTRRSFLSRLLAVLPALPLLPRLASARGPHPVSAAPGIPRQMDLRRELHPLLADVEVYRYGEKLLTAVAYDLDADTVTVLGQPLANGYTYYVLHGGVSVRWIDCHQRGEVA